MALAKISWASIAAIFLAFPRAGWATEDPCTGVLVSDALPVLINQHKIQRHLQHLQEISHAHGGSRMAGSAGNNQTIEYIKHELDNLGYYVETQKVDVMTPVNGNATLIVNGNSFQVDPVGWSPSANITDRPVVEYDYPVDSIGAVVLVNGDDCSFSDKSIAAHEAGADALLVYEDSQLVPSLGGQNGRHIPTARISEQARKDIMNQRNPVWVDLVGISTKTRMVHSHNVFATYECGDDKDTLLVGTHTDSVGNSSGINDNASGIASLLEVAAQLTKFRTKSRVKFAFWTAAEPCLLGSKHYVSTAYPEELRKIRLYLDVNMLGSPNGALKIYNSDMEEIIEHQKFTPWGSFEATWTLARGFEAQGVQSTASTKITNRSDYAPFYAANIAFAGLFSGANGRKTREEAELFGGTAGHPYDHNYHQPGDNITNINMTTLFLNTKALAHTVGTYGRSFDNFPARPMTTGAASRYTTPARYSTLMTQAWLAYSLLL
ncbi:hypothetical protein F4805DRAFT_474945 [Annulohypoxylon moriforme]|nr:hypothetical protein F4805DRAFT_474945 [Annulohypoxylon moriforme]